MSEFKAKKIVPSKYQGTSTKAMAQQWATNQWIIFDELQPPKPKVPKQSFMLAKERIINDISD